MAEQISFLYRSEDKGMFIKKGIKAPVSRLTRKPGLSFKHLRCSLHRRTSSGNEGDAPLKLFKWRHSAWRGIEFLFAVGFNSNSGWKQFKCSRPAWIKRTDSKESALKWTESLKRIRLNLVVYACLNCGRSRRTISCPRLFVNQRCKNLPDTSQRRSLKAKHKKVAPPSSWATAHLIYDASQQLKFDFCQHSLLLIAS